MKQIPWILIIVLIGIIIVQRECRSPEVITETKTVVEYEYIYDSIPYKEIIEKPVYIKLEPDTIYKTEDIDTAMILADYHTRITYKDTLINNESAFFYLEEEIFKNRIEHREFTFINRRPVGVEFEPIKLKTKLFAGGQVIGSPTQFGAGLSIGLITKQDNLYTLGYDVINKNTQLSVQWKIFDW